MRHKSFIIPLLFLLLGSLPNELGAFENINSSIEPSYGIYKSRALLTTVDYFESLFLTQYAPLNWKERYFGWNPQAEASLAKAQLYRLHQESPEAIKPIFNRLLRSTQDRHVGIFYYDFRAAWLPLIPIWIDGSVMVSWSGCEELQAGDLLLTVDGAPVLDYLASSLYGASWEEVGTVPSRQELARTFCRLGYRDQLPKRGAQLRLVVSRYGGMVEISLPWNWVDRCMPVYEEESHRALQTPKGGDFFQRLDPSAYWVRSAYVQMGVESTAKEEFYVPHWSIQEFEGKRIGYLRLPSFEDNAFFQEIDQAIETLNEESEALVIDLRENPGGDLLHCLALLCRLTDQPLVNLTESRLIDQSEANAAHYDAQLLEGLLGGLPTEELAELLHEWGLIAKGFPTDRQVLLGFLRHLHSIEEAWKEGKTSTRFEPLLGQATLQPHPSSRYSKPLVVLIDEDAASCSDLFCAVLKDNGRAILVGRTTAGAGGVMRRYQIPNFTGIHGFSLTRSLLLRSNQTLIENFGVSPHIEYPKTLVSQLHPEEEAERALRFAAKQLSLKRK